MARLFLAFLATLAVSAHATPYLWQTDVSSDNIYIYNLDNFSLARRLEVGANPHGIAVPEDTSVIYVSLEIFRSPHGEILWINPNSLEIERRLKVCRQPHNIEVTLDGEWLYVPCYDGYYSVINTRSGQVVKNIETGGRPHNVIRSNDGRYMYLAPLGRVNGVTIVDVQANHKVVGFIPFGGEVRPLSLSADGRRLFQQVTGVNGFRVADTGDQAVVATVEHQTGLGRLEPAKEFINRVYRKLGFERPFRLAVCHGLAVRPDQQEIWSTCGNTLSIHDMGADNYPELAHIELRGTGYWINFSPDGRYGVVAVFDRGQVVVVDTVKKKIVKVLEAGHSPKRNQVIEHGILDAVTTQ